MFKGEKGLIRHFRRKGKEYFMKLNNKTGVAGTETKIYVSYNSGKKKVYILKPRNWPLRDPMK